MSFSWEEVRPRVLTEAGLRAARDLRLYSLQDDGGECHSGMLVLPYSSEMVSGPGDFRKEQ